MRNRYKNPAMDLTFNKDTARQDVFATVRNFLQGNGFTVVTEDMERPWGGFFVIDERQASKFKNRFFDGATEGSEGAGVGRLSPKILVVESNKRLSWQYHFRRSEIWKVIGGDVGIVRSNDDTEGALEKKKYNDTIALHQGERHRLIGLDSWGIIAEIWQHTDSNHPSDENDIIRVQDDFGR